MKKKDLLSKTSAELKKTLEELTREIKNSKINLAVNKIKNTRLNKMKRKNIAIIKTILRKIELEAKNG